MFKIIDTINKRTYEVEEKETVKEIIKDLKREYLQDYEIKTKMIYKDNDTYELVEEMK